MEGYNYHERDDFTELSEQIAELNRKLDNMTMGLSGVHATQHPLIDYESFGGSYSTDWGTSNFESAQDVGNFNSQYDYLNSDFYDQGWQNHSNFYWQQEYEKPPQWGTEDYLPNYQVQIQPHHQPQISSSLVDMLMQHTSQLETHVRNSQVSFKNMQVQLDQIAQALEIESQESLLSDTENNLEQGSKEDYDDVEIVVEDEVKEVVEKSVKLNDSVKSIQSTKTTIMPIGVENESEVLDFAEYTNEIDIKPLSQQENKKESKFQPDEREKNSKEKGKNWADRKILDDQLRLCRRGLLFKAQKRLRRNTFNTRWRPFTIKSS